MPVPRVEVGLVIHSRMHARAPVDVWRSVRSLPDFWRLLQVRVASQFGDGLFQAGLAGALLFNPDRAADPMAIAGAFAVLFLPYSLLGPFAGALMDQWDRRWVLVGANTGRLALIAGVGTILAVGAGDVPLLVGALVANGLARFVASGLSAALPHVVPREQVVTMNSVAIASGAVSAFLGANFMLLPRWLLGSGDEGASAIVFLVAIPVSIALLWSLRFGPRVLGGRHRTRDPRICCLRRGHRLATWSAHRGATSDRRCRPVRFGSASDGGRYQLTADLAPGPPRDRPGRWGLGTALLFFAATGLGAFLANVLTPTAIRRWGRYATANGALAAAATIQVAAAGLLVPVMVVCGFLLGVAGQVVKLCADSAMQMDVDDALRGHVFAVQDALFWVSYILSITVAAALIPEHGHAPVFVLFGSAIYLAGLVVHTIVGRRGQPVIGR